MYINCVGCVNSDRSQRFAAEEVDLELFGTCVFRPSGLKRSKPREVDKTIALTTRPEVLIGSETPTPQIVTYRVSGMVPT